MTVRRLTRRIQPGSDPGEVVQIQEMRPCECQHCEFSRHGEMHWFPVGVAMPREKAEQYVAGHNRALARALR